MPHRSIETLRDQLEELKTLLSPCRLCPRHCGARRLEGERGNCQAGADLTVAHIGLHHGEEPPISGTRGSGTIFLTHCNLHCVFCQNWQISQQPESLATVQTFTPEQLGQAMIELQTQGAHNINWVSPTPWTPQLLESLLWARDHGLTLPIVYNSNGYDSLEALRGMDGAVDIYLPDLKYGEDHHAQSFSHAKGYVQASHTAINEMFRQVGLLQLDENDIATSGLIVRHLVLPSDSLATPSPSGLRPSPSPNKGEGDVSRSRTSLSPFGRGTEGEGVETPVHYSANPPSPLQFLASLDPNIHISLMSQYSPQYKAKDTPPLDQPLSMDDYDVAVAEAESLGLENVWIQEMESQTVFVPDFESERPFDGTPFLSKNSF